MSIPRRMLVATDFSAGADMALDSSLALAPRFGAEVQLFHALEVPLPLFEPYAVAIPDNLMGDARKVAREKLDAAFERVRAAGLEGGTRLGEVPAAVEIVEVAKELDADLIVTGTRGNTGLKHLLLGSVAESTVRHAACSVLVAKGDGLTAPPRHITVGIDFSDHSARALAVATEWAERFGSHVHLAHAVDLRIPFVAPYEVSVPSEVIESACRSAEGRLEEMSRDLSKRGIAASSVTITEPPAIAICDIAQKAGSDLIVNGSRGLSGIKHVLLGSVAERTLRHASCSVLTVRSDD